MIPAWRGRECDGELPYFTRRAAECRFAPPPSAGPAQPRSAAPSLTTPHAVATMGIFLDEPKYEVQDADPSFGKIVSNFNASDVGLMGGVTGISYPLGYIAGRSSGVPRQSAICLTIIGAMGGFMMAQQQSCGRLLGIFDNGKPLK
mmetsp:Transcript_13991/g.44446  ORF Transcript_13991/g.44446 Transcript_13991/m.44446 type:complete len:146 (+) Transcript_13991:432-869(+)